MTHLVQLATEPPAIAPMPRSGPLVDQYGRVHSDLRISVTDRCNIRCFYCMPEDGATFSPRERLISFPQLLRTAQMATRLGVNKIRITGGEPLLRPRLADLIADLAKLPIADLALTTNGVLLQAQARALRQAGLKRLNIHLDSLDRERFRKIARRDELERVLAGIEAATSEGFEIKLNAVAVRNYSEPDIISLVQFARKRKVEIRFIEFMPLDGQSLWDGAQVLTADEMIAILEGEFGSLRPIADPDPRAPASEYEFQNGDRVGFIASVSKPFCSNCNRLRLTSDGKLRNCLFARDEVDIRSTLEGGSDEELEQLFRLTVWKKWAGHQIGQPEFLAPERPMYSIGG